jgi:hypothetical protein
VNLEEWMRRGERAVRRLRNAWRAMDRERHLAALAALGLFVSMFLHWYSKTDTVVVRGAPKPTQTSLTAFQAFSFVEAAVLLVSAGVLALLFSRAEGHSFHLPGGDGTIVMLAGGWAALLIFYRLLDKPGLQGNQRVSATVGVEWGIFVALLVALGLVYAGRRMRSSERPEAPLRSSRRGPPQRDRDTDRSARRPPPESGVTAVVPAPARPGRSAPVPADRRAGRPRHPPAPGGQMSFEDRPTDTE